MRVGKFALMTPVMTSTLGRCVARMTCIPAARAFCASRATAASTSLPCCIIRSANSSTTMTIHGSFSGSGASPSSLPFSARDRRRASRCGPCATTTFAFGFFASPRATRSTQALYVRDVLRAGVGEELVAPLHLVDGPLERGRRLLHVGDDRQEHVRDAVEGRELDDLRVDHEQPQLVGRPAVEERQEHHVEARRSCPAPVAPATMTCGMLARSA